MALACAACVGCAIYQPRAAESGVLHAVIREHLEGFLRAGERAAGTGVPSFVEREFPQFLSCGVLARAFARVRCPGSAFERLVPFSCKGRGFCPSCGGRRMTERAAHLVDNVFSHVPVRQWVLTVPHRLRYLLAWDHKLCRAVLGVYARALLGFLRRRARRRGVVDGRGGAVTAIQRFGSAVNLNVHFRTLALDGVFALGDGDGLRFHPADPPSDEDVARLLATIRSRVLRLLARRGIDIAGADPTAAADDPVADESPLLAGLSSAAVQGRIALGRRARPADRPRPRCPLGHLGRSPAGAPRGLRPARRPRRARRRSRSARTPQPLHPAAPDRAGAPAARRGRAYPGGAQERLV
jgi:hypothetical protein